MNIISWIGEKSVTFDEVQDKIKCDVNVKPWYSLYLLSAVLTIPIFGPNVIFGFHHFIFIGFIWSLPHLLYKGNRYIIDKSIENSNSNMGPPHEVVDNFLKWEEGDKIETDHFEGEYVGVDKKGRIVLDTVWINNEVICLPTGYLKACDEFRNKTLEKRTKKKTRKRVKSEAKNKTEYDKLVDEFKKEYKRLENNDCLKSMSN